jgi:hypothetical protein
MTFSYLQRIYFKPERVDISNRPSYMEWICVIWIDSQKRKRRETLLYFRFNDFIGQTHVCVRPTEFQWTALQKVDFGDININGLPTRIIDKTGFAGRFHFVPFIGEFSDCGNV